MRKGLTVLAVVVVLGIIVGGILQWIGSQDNPPTPPPTDGPTTQAQQPDWCPNVEVVAAPGTWESASTDDPYNPTFNPMSYMLSVTRPLQEAHPADDVRVWTLPYVAQFKNINSQQEVTYDESRTEGTTRAQEEMTKTHNECPLTDFILVGFSQGAVIMGDIANAIGQGTGPIPADRVRGVALGAVAALGVCLSFSLDSCDAPSSLVPAVRVDGRVTAACAAANWSDTFFAEAAFFAAFVGAFLVVFFVAFADFCVRVGAGTLSVSAVFAACGSSVAAASGPLPPMRIFAASSPKRGLFVEGPLGINAARPRPSPPLRLSGAMKTLKPF